MQPPAGRAGAHTRASPPGTRLAALAALAAVGWPAAAPGAPLEDPTVEGAVFSGITQAHASSIFINPAALALAPAGWHVYLGGSLRADAYRIDRQVVDAEGTVTGGPSVRPRTLTPGGLLAAYVGSERVGFGIAMGTPRSEEFISDELALGYHVLGGHHYQLNAAALAGALRLGNQAVVGFGLALQGTSLQLSYLRDTALDGGSAGVDGDCGGQRCGVEHPEAAERHDVRAATENVLSAGNLAVSFGAMFMVRDGWWLAGSFRSPPGLLSAQRLTGTTEVTAAPRDGGGVRRGDAEVIYRLPQTITLGLRGPVLPGADLITSVRWQNWNRHDRLDIRAFGGDLGDDVPEWTPRYRGFDGAFLGGVMHLAVGLEQHDTGGTLRGGVRLHAETGAVSTRELSPLQVAGFNLGLAGGAELRLGQALVIGGSYGITWFPTRRAAESAFDPRARVRCVDSGFDVDECAAVREGRAMPTAAGTYGRLSHALLLSLRWDQL